MSELQRTFFVKRTGEKSFEVENLSRGTYAISAQTTKEMIARIGESSIYCGWFWDEDGNVVHVFRDDKP